VKSVVKVQITCLLRDKGTKREQNGPFSAVKKLKNVSNGGGRKKSINFALFIVISIITDTGRKRKKTS
jgi:hypothetical protein